MKSVILILLSIYFSINLFSQDIIVKDSNSKINCIINVIDGNHINYNDYINPYNIISMDSIEYCIYKEEIFFSRNVKWHVRDSIRSLYDLDERLDKMNETPIEYFNRIKYFYNYVPYNHTNISLGYDRVLSKKFLLSGFGIVGNILNIKKEENSSESYSFRGFSLNTGIKYFPMGKKKKRAPSGFFLSLYSKVMLFSFKYNGEPKYYNFYNSYLKTQAENEKRVDILAGIGFNLGWCITVRRIFIEPSIGFGNGISSAYNDEIPIINNDYEWYKFSSQTIRMLMFESNIALGYRF